MPTALHKPSAIEMKQGGGWERGEWRGEGEKGKRKMSKMCVCLEAFGGWSCCVTGTCLEATGPHTEQHYDAAEEIKRPRGGKNLDTDQWISVFSHCLFSCPRSSFVLPPHEIGPQLTGVGMLDEGNTNHKDQCCPSGVGFWDCNRRQEL